MDEAEPTYAPAANAYHAPTRDDDPDYFAWLDYLATRDSISATDGLHGLCFNCKFNSVRVKTSCWYGGSEPEAGDGECTWEKVK